MRKKSYFLRNIAIGMILLSVAILGLAICLIIINKSDQAKVMVVLGVCTSISLAYAGLEVYKKSEEVRKPMWHETWRV